MMNLVFLLRITWPVEFFFDVILRVIFILLWSLPLSHKFFFRVNTRSTSDFDIQDVKCYIVLNLVIPLFFNKMKPPGIFHAC